MRFIFGKLNGEHLQVYAWKVPDGMSVEVGDYAVVENMEGFTLVEVCAIAETDQGHAKYITGHWGGMHKWMVAGIKPDALKSLSESLRDDE